MSTLRSMLRSGYDWTASTFGQHRRSNAQAKLWVLMYHRVLPESDPRFALEEPGMVVTPDTLNMHIEECKKMFQIVSLDDWVSDYRNDRPLPQKACALTFDDGWQDNLDYAEPILKRHQVPATLFAVVNKIGTDFRFWPNIIAELMAQNTDFADLHPLLSSAGNHRHAAFSREALADTIQHLKQYSEDDIFKALDSIGWQDALMDSPDALMNWPDLKHSEFDIGCHTGTHRRLTSWLSESELDHEIIDSFNTLKRKVPACTSLFCYPNGDYDDRALSRVQQVYQAAVTTQKGINTAGSLNLHALKRIPIHDDVSNTPVRFRARLAAW